MLCEFYRMRAVLQRVKEASVTVDNQVVGSIKLGLLVLLGVEVEDREEDSLWIADKILNLRIFQDKEDKMNLSALDQRGEILMISQFTLFGDCRKGRRPSYSNAAPPAHAKELYLHCVDQLRKSNLTVKTGIFQAHMEVHLVNDGPVTLLLDSKRQF